MGEQSIGKIRQPIVTVLGHVDHGKTTLLDFVRNTVVAKKEAGRITQDIGATDVNISAILDIASEYLKNIKDKIKIPGLLFIDTPGHLAFTAMREKGGAIADLAILVIDINEGIKPQTEESLKILRKFKTPFVIALTKIDKLPGWRNMDKDFLINFREQSEHVKREFYEKLYRIEGELSNYGFNSAIFSEIKDFTKEVAIVPCSGITGEGIPNLFTVLIGLSQKFLVDKLKISGKGKGVILELKKDEKLGNNMDVILYDGTLEVGDELLVELSEPVFVKIRGLLKPSSLQDIRVEKKFVNIDKISAAAGVKIIGKNVEKVLAGANFQVVNSEAEKDKLLKELKKEQISKEIEEQTEGIILRASNLGGLEALINLFEGVKIKRAKIGPPTKEDIIALESVSPENKVLICFNVENPFRDIANSKGIKVIEGNIIYKLFEEFEEWREELKRKEEEERKQKMKKIAKIKLLKGFVFRQSNPAIVGIEVLAGILEEGAKLINKEGKIIGKVEQIQREGKTIKRLEKDGRGAISIPKVTIGRQIKEEEILYSYISREEYRELKNYEEVDKELLEEIKEILNYL